MGIDIYMKWDNQTEEEESKQITGFSITSGAIGYLREAYHGGPYATHYLVREAFNADDCEATISAVLLQSRLPTTIALSLYRNFKNYEQGKEPGVLTNFDGLADADALIGILGPGGEIEQIKNGTDNDLNITDNAARQIIQKVGARTLPDYALTFADFVSLAKRKEEEKGKPVTICASY